LFIHTLSLCVCVVMWKEKKHIWMRICETTLSHWQEIVWFVDRSKYKQQWNQQWVTVDR
jgi:hypothetical protein